MAIEYDDRTWDIGPTKDDANSFFHAAFGVRKTDDDCYVEKTAPVRRTNWINFLSYYKIKPRRAGLKTTLKGCFDKHGWSVDDDVDFDEYARRAGDDRQILPDELPLLASLENVRVVLFVAGEASPEIIDPSTEILGDYPLVNTNPLETAVVILKDSKYSKLTARSPEAPQPEDEEREEPTRKLRKRHLGALSGIWYQIHLLSIAMLNALRRYDTWRLSSEVARAGYFDDLVLEWGPTNSAFLLQAKWRKRPVRKSDLLGGKYSGFCLAKYFFGYREIKRSFKVNGVALCTNTSVIFEDLIDHISTRTLDEEDLLYFEGVESICHTFKEDVVPMLSQNFKSYDAPRSSFTEDDVKSFLKDFQIISLYPEGRNLEEAVESGIGRLGISGSRDSAATYARHLNRKIMEWYDETEDCLTPLRAKVIFCELKSNKLLEKLRDLDLVLKPDRVNVTISTRISHVVPQGDYALTLLKVSEFLANENSETLYLSTDEPASSQKMAAEAFEYRPFSYLVIYKSAPVEEVAGLCEAIARILKEFAHKRVVLIADEQDELARELRARDGGAFETVEDKVKFTDLTEDSQERLLERAVLFYEANL